MVKSLAAGSTTLPAFAHAPVPLLGLLILHLLLGVALGLVVVQVVQRLLAAGRRRGSRHTRPRRAARAAPACCR